MMDIETVNDRIFMNPGDSEKAIKEMDDNQFDIAFVDPPFRDNNAPTKDMRKLGNSMFSFGKKPTEEFFKELFRVSKHQIIFGANNFVLPPNKGFIIAYKTSVPVNFTMSQADYIWIDEGLGTTSKVFEYRPQSDVKKIQSTQKPVSLFKFCLRLYAKPGWNILDTHMGSGSSAIACWEYGCRFVGYEINKERFDNANKRVRQHIAQTKLKLF